MQIFQIIGRIVLKAVASPLINSYTNSSLTFELRLFIFIGRSNWYTLVEIRAAMLFFELFCEI